MANLVITSECNGICPFCFAEETVRKPVQRMDLAMVERLAKLCAGEAKMQLIGGEPTLHPDVVAFVELLSRHNFPQIFVVTNLMGPTPVIARLLDLSRCGFLVNIHGSEFVRNPALRERFRANLALFKARRFAVTLGITLFSLDQDFEYLYSLLREDEGQSVVAVRVSPSVPTAGNRSLMGPEVGEKWLSVVREIHRICPAIRIHNDCQVINGCMFTPATYAKLSGCVDNLQMATCTGYSCPFDILPDGSVRYCYGTFGVEEMSLPNIFEFPNIRAARDEIHRRSYHWTRTRGLARCAHEECDFLACHGVCPAILAYRNPAASR